jgi:hypothetical protein
MIQPYAYYTVQGWMREELGLKGNALAVYAIIYGFSQDGASEYAGSARYLADWLGCDKKTVLRALSDLTEKGHLIKRTTYQNGVTFCNYVAARNVQTDSADPRDKITPPGTKCPQGGEKLSPEVGTKCPQGGEKLSPEVGTKCPQGGEKLSSHNTRDNTRYINKEIYIGDAGASTAPPEKEKGKEKPVKHKYGEYDNVLLTDEELAKLQKQFGRELPAYIERLSGYIASTGKKYKSHYATIRNWASRDAKQQPARPAARGGYQVGPNGIAYDPAMNDLDGIF